MVLISNPPIKPDTMLMVQVIRNYQKMNEILNQSIETPERLSILADKPKDALLIDANFDTFKKYLSNKYA